MNKSKWCKADGDDDDDGGNKRTWKSNTLINLFLFLFSYATKWVAK